MRKINVMNNKIKRCDELNKEQVKKITATELQVKIVEMHKINFFYYV